MDKGSKICLQCEEPKQISEFQQVGPNKVRRNICKQCFNYNQRKTREKLSEVSDLLNGWPAPRWRINK